ncbi:hypothetical protein LINPERHAP1_LOCUS30885 [Linum perenne]
MPNMIQKVRHVQLRSHSMGAQHAETTMERDESNASSASRVFNRRRGKELVDATIQSEEFMAYDYNELESIVVSHLLRSTCDIPWADNELVDLSYGVTSEG